MSDKFVEPVNIAYIKTLDRIIELEKEIKYKDKVIEQRNAMCSREMKRAEQVEAERDEALKYASIAAVENKRLKEKYEDLIMQVACKFPNETRHDTAKRYIQERENREVPEAQQALQGER